MTDGPLTLKQREALELFVLFVRQHPELSARDPMMSEAFCGYMAEAQTQDERRERWAAVVDDAQLHEAEQHSRWDGPDGPLLPR